jgi:hypothetical protein
VSGDNMMVMRLWRSLGVEEIEPVEEDVIEESARDWELELARAKVVMVEMHAAARGGGGSRREGPGSRGTLVV